MQLYTANITKIEKGFLYIFAENEQQARQKAYEEAEQGNVFWGREKIAEVEVVEKPEKSPETQER